MTSNTAAVDSQEISFRDSLHDLTKKWWLVAGVTLFAIIAAILLISIQGQKYEARTRVLIVPRNIQTVQNETTSNPVTAGPELSVEALSTLATARDLMQAIIVKLNLKDSNGNYWPVERLAMMISPTVETAG